VLATGSDVEEFLPGTDIIPTALLKDNGLLAI
jgi:hypothetical protein